MGHPVKMLELTEEERAELTGRVTSPTVSKRDHLRARIVLLGATEKTQQQIRTEVGASIGTVNKWCRRFELHGLDGLRDLPGRGRPSRLPPEKVERVVTAVTQPPPGRTRWSVRSMSREVGISPSSVQRIWRANDLKPHRVRTFKLSHDKQFEQKFWDVIGLYLDPPEQALVFCCDEKSQCQALERTQPGLPLGVGEIRTRTHDYKRHGTVTLFAALDYLNGKLVYRTEQQHTHVQWLRFLKQLDRETPGGLDLHLVLDNYCTHKEKTVTSWLKKHPRFHLHFTPTGSSWMNLVERFFADLSQDVILDGSFSSVRELVESIEDYLVARNLGPKPYRWKAKGEEILRKIQHAREALAEQQARAN